MSVDEATLDLMVARASLPDLGAMIRGAKEAGLIEPVYVYEGQGSAA